MCRLFQKSSFCVYTTSGVFQKYSIVINKTSPVTFNNIRFVHDENETENLEAEEPGLTPISYEETPPFIRNALYPTSKNPITNRLVNCTSIQEALDIIKANNDNLGNEQITQATATFWDLIKVIQYLSGIPETKENVRINKVVLQLHNDPKFKILLNLIEKNINSFTASDLSYVHLHLCKLGLDEYHNTIKLIVDTLKLKLREQFSLSSASRFITSCFIEYSLRSHFNVQPFIPLVFNELGV